MANANIIKQKEEQVKKLAEVFKGSNIVLLVDYRGINVENDTALRKSIREVNGKYSIIKNNIVRRALKEDNYEGFDEVLEGPTAVITTEDEYLPVLKAIYKFSKDNDYYTIKGGIIEGKAVSVDEILTLAKLPSREELIAKLAGSLLANITKLAATLDAVRVSKEEK